MSATEIKQTPEGVRRLAIQSIKNSLSTSTLPPADLALLARFMLAFVPKFHAMLHEERIQKMNVVRDMRSGDIKATGVIVLSNMLQALSRNTTAENPGEDRDVVTWAETRRLHALLLDNLKDNEQSTGDQSEDDAVMLALEFNEGIKRLFEDAGGVPADVITIACMITLEGYFAQLPPERKAEIVTKIAPRLKEIGLVP
jgi:hypothetical protein